MISLEEFSKLYESKFGHRKVYPSYPAEQIYQNYLERVEPFLSVITEFRIGDEKARHDQLKVALALNEFEFKVMKDCIKELKEALNANKSVMELKAQIDIQRGLINTDYTNAKILEMQSVRYDEGYKPKGKEVEVTLPKIEIEYKDASVTPNELEERYDDIE